METTKTIGFIGPGRIGLPICAHLVKAGYRVLGYRRSPMTEFAGVGGTPASSPAQVGAEADIVFTCLPSDEALEEVVQGPRGLVHSARPGQIKAVIETRFDKTYPHCFKTKAFVDKVDEIWDLVRVEAMKASHPSPEGGGWTRA